MKVIRVVCPKCGMEKFIKEGEQNTTEYREELVTHQKCPDCRLSLSAEDKLLEAMFGGSGEGLDFWKEGGE